MGRRRAGERDLMPAVGDAVPAGLGCELDRLPAALGLGVHEPVPLVIEADVELSLLDALVKPSTAKDQPSQPMDERALRGPHQLGPTVVDVLTERRSGIGHLAVDYKADEVLGLVVLDRTPEKPDLARRLLTAFAEISLIECEPQLPVLEHEVFT